jgi:hypothetical protein
MKDHSAMSESALINAVPGACGAGQRSNIRERVVVALLLYSLLRSAQVLAADQASVFDAAPKFDAPNFRLSPDSFAPLPSSFSATEFRPRPQGANAADPARAAGRGIESPMLQDTPVWQEMSQYKTRDGVRLLTLLQTRGSTLSLQAGKRGGPSLQWSSPWMMRENAKRGLFDRLFSVYSRAGTLPRASAPRSSVAATATKSIESAAPAGSK